jgi:hypothetical protein
MLRYYEIWLFGGEDLKAFGFKKVRNQKKYFKNVQVTACVEQINLESFERFLFFLKNSLLYRLNFLKISTKVIA